jgi:hypothetical protein
LPMGRSPSGFKGSTKADTRQLRDRTAESCPEGKPQPGQRRW